MSDLPARFSRAYERHFATIYRFLQRLGVHERDLDDVCHEVFLVFLRRFSTVNEERDRAFLFGAAYRVASDYRKLSRHRERSGEEAILDLRGTDHPENLYAMRKDLEAVLDRLSDERRAVFVMFELEGLAAPEIAALANLPLNTVYSRLRLAREDFDRLQQELGGER